MNTLDTTQTIYLTTMFVMFIVNVSAIFYIANRVNRPIKIHLKKDDLEDKKEVCRQCLEPLLTNTLFCYKCGDQHHKICERCHTKMPMNALYCPSCRSRMWFKDHAQKVEENEENI